MFAKMFNTELGQIVVMIGESPDTGMPCISYYYEVDGQVGAVHMEANENTEQAKVLMNDVFHSVTEEHALEMVSVMVEGDDPDLCSWEIGDTEVDPEHTVEVEVIDSKRTLH